MEDQLSIRHVTNATLKYLVDVEDKQMELRDYPYSLMTGKTLLRTFLPVLVL